MSATDVRDPFDVCDPDGELELGRIAEQQQAPRLERWLSLGLLALALVLILWVGVRLAGKTPNYGPAGEASRVAFLEHVALRGTPPVLGEDTFVVDPKGPLPARAVAIRQLEPGIGGGPSVVVAGTRYPQELAVADPYPYYLAAPVSWVIDWRHRLFALRFLCVMLLCAGVAFLWRAVRESWPANPLAAGVAAIVLATMGGLVSAFSAFQPQALLFAFWCAGLWLGLRDARRRECSGWSVGVWTAATCVDSIALPMALMVVTGTSLWAARGRSFGRHLAARLAVVLAPTLAWVAWNLHAYGDPWPLNVVAGGDDRPRDWSRLTSLLDPISKVNSRLFQALYNGGLEPLTKLDVTPAGFLAVALVAASTMALLTGRIVLARLALVRFSVLMLASFASIYVTLFLSTVVAGLLIVDAGAANYGGYAAAWAGVAGIVFTAPLGGRRWLAPAAVAVLTVALVVVLLRTPVA